MLLNKRQKAKSADIRREYRECDSRPRVQSATQFAYAEDTLQRPVCILGRDEYADEGAAALL